MGIWDDKGSNQGDLTNARIYRKMTLLPGTYYFGAAYNSLYQCNEQAYMFVSKELCPTNELPDKSVACYQVNTAKEGTDLYGLYVQITERGEYYVGWQANLNNGKAQQEFRATNVVFYRIMAESGQFKGSIKEDLTNAVLVEGENFSGELSGSRYGTLQHWITENYNINKGNDGTRNGLDNYGNRRGISLGVWDDRESNQGDLANARIYRKVTLSSGTYYFGAAYNSLSGCNDMAYMFVSKELGSTDELPDKSIACYQVNTARESDDLYGLYVQIKEDGEYYIGWQANLNNGKAQQEFRAVRVVFYRMVEPAYTIDIVLDENSTDVPDVKDIYANVTLKRSFKTNNWNTFCVPFDLPVDNFAAVKELSECNMSGSVAVLTFRDATVIKAGKPYIVKPKADMPEEPVFKMVAMKAGEPEPVPVDNVTMIGNYPKGNVPLNAFFINNDAFYRADDGNKKVTLKGFRAYLNWVGQAEEASVNRMFIDIDGNTTAIENVFAGKTAGDDSPVDVYTLSGLKVKTGVKRACALDGLAKGFYIVGGKKVVK